MDKQIKKKWVAALRSGDFKQGRCYLKQGKPGEEYYCCLGVLVEITQPKAFTVQCDITEPQTLKDSQNSPMSGTLPPRMLKKFDLARSDQDSLTRMNDGYDGYDNFDSKYRLRAQSFDEIADWIEKNL